MYKILVKGNNKPLIGKVNINGSKNAILVIIAASLLSTSSITLHNVPDLIDVHLMSDLLKSLGAKIKFIHNKIYKANHTLKIDCSNINNHILPYKTVNNLRASFLILGPMLSRFGKIKTTFPGGCNIGNRPVDMHIKALKKMGAQIKIEGSNINATVKGRLQGKKIKFEKISVGSTENIIMAATLADGITVIYNASIEPEVINLIEFLKKIGAKIGIYTNTINYSNLIKRDKNYMIDNKNLKYNKNYEFINKNYKNVIIIKGVQKLNGCIHKIISDRIEAGTYSLAAIITGGRLILKGINLLDIKCILKELKAIGALIEINKDSIIISRKKEDFIKPINVVTDSYPNFPSDMQPQLMSAMCIAEGISTIKENVFEKRFSHVIQLRKLGAKINIEKNRAIINGVKKLYGTILYGNNLRSTAALILASLIANGETIINDSYHLLRGYEAMDEKLNSCGANISVLS